MGHRSITRAATVSPADPLLAVIRDGRVRWAMFKDMQPRVFVIDQSIPAGAELQREVDDIRRAAYVGSKRVGMKARTEFNPDVNGQRLLSIQFFIPDGERGPTLLDDDKVERVAKRAKRKVVKKHLREITEDKRHGIAAHDPEYEAWFAEAHPELLQDQPTPGGSR